MSQGFFNGMLSHMKLPPQLLALHEERVQELKAPKWAQALAALGELDGTSPQDWRRHAEALKPWRKGPFQWGDFLLDAEWDCRQKFARLAPHLPPLADKKILDVGCGNGWYLRELVKAGATQVLGFDPQHLCYLQWLFAQKLAPVDSAELFLLGAEELPLLKNTQDLILYMGVLYHHRDPLTQLIDLREALVPGGELYLETIGVPGEGPTAYLPAERYANMSNVWFLPTLECLVTMLQRARFVDIEVLSRDWGRQHEQRKTMWIEGPSFLDALDPSDPARTVEGHPAPERFLVRARRKKLQGQA